MVNGLLTGEIEVGWSGIPNVMTLRRLQAQAAAVMREPALAARMKQLGMVMEENGTASYRQFLKYDLERYAQAVRKLNLQ